MANKGPKEVVPETNQFQSIDDSATMAKVIEVTERNTDLNKGEKVGEIISEKQV